MRLQQREIIVWNAVDGTINASLVEQLDKLIRTLYYVNVGSSIDPLD